MSQISGLESRAVSGSKDADNLGLAERFRALVDQEVAAVVIIRRDGRFAYVNRGLCTMLGQTREEMVGRLAHEFVAEENRAEAAGNIAKLIAGEIGTDRFFATLKSKDGSVHECLMQGTVVNYEGEPAVIGVAVDISELRRAQRELERTNRQLYDDASLFRGLVEQELAGVFILEQDGSIGYINPRFVEMLGYTDAEVRGRHVTDFIAESDRERVAKLNSEVVTGARRSMRVTAFLLRKNGALLPVLAQGNFANYHGAPAIMGVALDISELKLAQSELERSNRILKTLSAGNNALVHAKTETELLGRMCRIMIDIGGFALAWIGYPQADAERSVRPVALAGLHEDFIRSLNVSWSETERGSGPTGRALRTGEIVISRDLAVDSNMEPWRDGSIERGLRSVIALPLKDGGKTFASITIAAHERDAFTGDEVKLLTDLASDLAYGILSLRARVAQEESTKRLRQSLQDAVLAIASTLETRDPYTAGHQRGVARLAMAIARELDVPEDDLEGIFLAGVVHDIGKIQIPSEILSKPGKLTPLEFELVKTHAQGGYDILKGVKFPWPVAEMVLQHHERLDGSGYPRGLKSDQILLGSKIIAVADVVQAMTSHRPYRPARGLDAALAEIEANKATKYYAPAVEACIGLFRNKGFTFESEADHALA